MPHDDATAQPDGNRSGDITQPWVVRYGRFLLAGNKTARSIILTLPAGVGNARDLLAHSDYPLGSKVVLAPGRAAAIVLQGYTPPTPTAGPLLPVPAGTYTLTVAVSGLALEPAGADTRIVQNAPSRADTQRWTLTPSDGFYTVKNVAGGLFLTSAGALKQQAATGGDDQLWRLLPDGPGFVFVSKGSGLDIDDPASSTQPGENLGTYQWGGNLNQTLRVSSL